MLNDMGAFAAGALRQLPPKSARSRKPAEFEATTRAFWQPESPRLASSARASCLRPDGQRDHAFLVPRAAERSR